MTESPVLLTKITPPQVSARSLLRPRVAETLLESRHYRVTLVQAGAGYGKSTAVISLVNQHRASIWYQITREDTDPYVFLQHLLHATRIAFPGLDDLPISTLESWDSSRGPLPVRDLLYRYLNSINVGLDQPTLLILEDLHLAAHSTEILDLVDQLVNMVPAQLHVILTSRAPLDLPSRSRWLSRGQILEIDQDVLAFTPDEINQLYKHRFDISLSEEEVDFLFDATEGWAITLPMIAQSLRKKNVTSVYEALDLPSSSLDSLFEMLAEEILAQQTTDVRRFMEVTATLQVLTPEACDAITGLANSAEMLEHLYHQELFVLRAAEGQYRYHHIFHRFLRRQVDETLCRAWHERAREYFLGTGDLQAAFYHSLKSGDESVSADILCGFAEDLLRKGRFTSLSELLDELAPETLHRYPLLLFMLGDLARLQSRFQEAMGWYQQAEALWREQGQMEAVSRALRGQARVYLDTVNPTKAEELLQQALRLTDGTADRDTLARLYELLAENKLNAGKGDQAESLRQHAQELRREGPADSQLKIRVLLRTGRLEEARQELERLAEIERSDPVQQPRAHRETMLLLSFIYVLLGESQAALDTALEGTRRGEALNSPFVAAVGYMRQGHALTMLSISDRYEQARRMFEKAIALSHSHNIPRLRIEALWGLTRVFGYLGDLAAARRVAVEGIEMASSVGDEWIASLIHGSLGVCAIMAGEYEEGFDPLTRAIHGFEACSDPFGLTAARLWRSIGCFERGDLDQFADSFKLVLESSLRHGYSPLLTRPTLLGLHDERRLVPLLLAARKHGWAQGYPDRLLHEIGLGEVQYHPGYQLRIETLGAFTVSRGESPIQPGEWKREKTRQMLEVLVTHRLSPLDRDQICECLWPGFDPESSHRNFKVALSTLYRVLEPEREAGAESSYVVREGSTYALRPHADIWIDVEAIETLVQEAENLQRSDTHGARRLLWQAVDLYQGDFLPDALYETWAAAERERITTIFLKACDRLCDLTVESDPEKVIQLCQRVLSIDNCSERAYRFLMQAYARLGDHGQVARVFQTCLDTLRKELDVAPASQTFELFQTLTRAK